MPEHFGITHAKRNSLLWDSLILSVMSRHEKAKVKVRLIWEDDAKPAIVIDHFSVQKRNGQFFLTLGQVGFSRISPSEADDAIPTVPIYVQGRFALARDDLVALADMLDRVVSDTTKQAEDEDDA